MRRKKKEKTCCGDYVSLDCVKVLVEFENLILLFFVLQVGEAIGKGGFATVYRALDMERGDFVAIKEIEKRLLSSDQLPKIMQVRECLPLCYMFSILSFAL